RQPSSQRFLRRGLLLLPRRLHRGAGAETARAAAAGNGGRMSALTPSMTHEVNFDGLVGPTHNFAGLSTGNVASMSHRGAKSNPRAAALQGLAKMKALADLGVKQAVLPPHERPSVAALRALGFGGTDAAVLRAASETAPDALVACSSASNMWVANAATVSPGA